VHRDDLVALAHGARADATQLLHVAADAEEEAEVDAERADVGAGLARDPEDAEVAVVVELDELAVVDGADAQLALDGRDEGRALEEGARERLDGARELLLGLEGAVEAQDADVLLACERKEERQARRASQRERSGSGRTCALLRLDEAGRAVDADGEAARDLGIEGARVARLLAAEDAADPGDDLVR